jgi:predicted nucleic acid-binding protein
MSVGLVIDLTKQIALLAADLSLEHGLAMADSVIYATTRIYNATLWTQDAHFAGLEGVRYLSK